MVLLAVGSMLQYGPLTKDLDSCCFQVLPIFSLAVADLGLALLWIIGGALWLRGVENRQFCFIVSLLTVVLVCVSVNLTVVYASVSYSIIKKTDLSGLLAYMDPDSAYGWSKIKTILVYSIAWCLPAVIVLGLFGVVAGSTDVLQNTDICSCWCAPVLSNVMPYAVHIQQVHSTLNDSINGNFPRGRLSLFTT
jgi:hypothetical protein